MPCCPPSTCSFPWDKKNGLVPGLAIAAQGRTAAHRHHAKSCAEDRPGGGGGQLAFKLSAQSAALMT